MPERGKMQSRRQPSKQIVKKKPARKRKIIQCLLASFVGKALAELWLMRGEERQTEGQTGRQEIS